VTDFIIGWAGVALGMSVPIPQLIKIFRYHKLRDISAHTYFLLCLAMSCYLFHAIYIRDAVFITAQSANLITNGCILSLLLSKRLRGHFNIERGADSGHNRQ